MSARDALAAALALVGGLAAFVLVFSDAEPATASVLVLAAILLGGGFAVGYSGARWWLAGLLASGGVLLGGLGLVGMARGITSTEYLANAVGIAIGPLAVALAAGYAGGRLRGSRRPTSD